MMKLLSSVFKILQVFGFWRPVNLYYWKKWLYNIYTIIILFIVYSTIILKLIELCKLIENIEVFVHNSVILLSEINACVKVTNICCKRNDIIKLMNILMTKSCSPQNNDEEKIQRIFDNIIQRNLLIYGVITEIAVSVVIINSIINDVPNRRLPFKFYIPFNYNTEILYWIIFIYQCIAVIIGSYMNICYEILIAGCMIQTCAQLELFKYRMNNLCHIENYYYKNYDVIIYNNNCTSDIEIELLKCEKDILSNCIKHHLEIFRFAELANEIFTYTIFFQYSVSLIVICTTAFKISNLNPLTVEFLSIIIYLMCMLLQIYILCYHGSKVTHKSINICNDIYAMDWMQLNQSLKKSLLIIMARTFKPIKFTSGHLVILSLKSFNRLLKLSYSVYNLLRHINHE